MVFVCPNNSQTARSDQRKPGRLGGITGRRRKARSGLLELEAVEQRNKLFRKAQSALPAELFLFFGDSNKQPVQGKGEKQFSREDPGGGNNKALQRRTDGCADPLRGSGCICSFSFLCPGGIPGAWNPGETP